MYCSGCGTDIPFGGEVCPNCHRDKSGDQSAHAIGMACGLGGGLIGWFVGGFMWAIGGVVVGLIVGVVVGAQGDGDEPSQPPEIRLSEAPGSSDDIEPRLQRIDDMHARGLISDDERKSKRAAILEEL